MAYQPISDGLSINDFLVDISSRKEFQPQDINLKNTVVKGFRPGTNTTLVIPGLKLTGAQLFIRNFENPDTNYKRLLIKWQTGVGKSIAALSISQEFIKQYRIRETLEGKAPAVIIISFTHRETFQEDMLRYPEFGFVSQFEAEELRRLRTVASAAGPGSIEARQYSSTLGVYRRRITDRTRGGFYQFYGYKEFANHLFNVTYQGIQNKFDVQELYNRNDDEFTQRLINAVKRGDVKINTALLNEIKGGLLICDEIHNVYNISEPNNYGIAIQYLLDALDEEAPHVVYMSATPITGSAAEIVDLMNLLVPKSVLPDRTLLRRADFFTHSSTALTGMAVSQLKEGALDKISKLAAGRVSFLLDSDTGSYPRRIFIGEVVENVPYIRMIKCPMSKLHEDTIRARCGNLSAGFAAADYTLYNMVFPSPEASVGLYQSGDTITILKQASQEWRTETGVIIESGAEYGLSSDLITGPFLSIENLGKYSTKYLAILQSVIAALKEPGKIMVYHHKVRMSGVLLLQEMFKMNGFVDETSLPTDSTLCAVCGTARVDHTASHDYQPARFIVAHHDIERSVMMRSIYNFNSVSNLEGYRYRIIIGSKIIREGYNFKAIRWQFIASLPTDFPTMIQVFGRVVRKDSHADLPPELRDVKISVFVSVFSQSMDTSPEMQRYIDKGKEYLVIQDVERALHINAIDGFANFDKIQAALGQNIATIDALPYTPAVTKPPRELQLSTFLAYGHGEREVATIASICRTLFQAQTVWTYSDLWSAVRASTMHAAFDEGNFVLALNRLSKPMGTPPTEIMRAGKYFILVDSNGLDVGSYLGINRRSQGIRVSIPDYINASLLGQNWSIRIKKFEHEYLAEGARAIETCLVDYSAEFHYALIRLLITRGNSHITINDELILNLYDRFKILIRGASGTSGNFIGYIDTNSVVLYVNGEWINKPHSDYKIGRRYDENDIVIGFTVPDNATAAKFKIRPPAQKIKMEHKLKSDKQRMDIRNLSRGAVCETTPRENLYKYLCKLRKLVSDKVATRGGSAPHASEPHGGLASVSATNEGLASVDGRASDYRDLSYALRLDQTAEKRFPSSIEMCSSIKMYLLALEGQSRAKSMDDSVRWVYIFGDKPPALSALVNRG
jgi:hypothetical protein